MQIFPFFSSLAIVYLIPSEVAAALSFSCSIVKNIYVQDSKKGSKPNSLFLDKGIFFSLGRKKWKTAEKGKFINIAQAVPNFVVPFRNPPSLGDFQWHPFSGLDCDYCWLLL